MAGAAVIRVRPAAAMAARDWVPRPSPIRQPLPSARQRAHAAATPAPAAAPTARAAGAQPPLRREWAPSSAPMLDLHTRRVAHRRRPRQFRAAPRRQTRPAPAAAKGERTGRAEGGALAGRTARSSRRRAHPARGPPYPPVAWEVIRGRPPRRWVQLQQQPGCGGPPRARTRRPRALRRGRCARRCTAGRRSWLRCCAATARKRAKQRSAHQEPPTNL